MSSNTKKDAAAENLGNLGQIRDILFGQHVREFGDRFARLETDMAHMQKELLERIERVRDTASLELRAAVEAMEKKVNALGLETREERADLEQELHRTRDKLSNTLTVLDESLDRQTASLRDDLLQSNERLQTDMRELRAGMMSQLDRYVSNLQDAKVSREAMAELLFEMGMRLKGAEMAPELQAVNLPDALVQEIASEGKDVDSPAAASVD